MRLRSVHSDVQSPISPLPRVECVGGLAQLSSQLIELLQHRSDGDVPSLSFLNNDTSSQKRLLQPDSNVGGVDATALLVLANEEGDQPADEIARHSGQKNAHCDCGVHPRPWTVSY